MAFVAGRQAALTAGGTALTSYIDSMTVSRSWDLTETTTFGNVGKTLSYVPSPPAVRAADLQELAGALGNGEIKTVIVLGGNPAYDAPADLDLAAKLAKVPNRIRLGGHVDETSAVCEWHLPQAHFLESWGDARALDGSLSIVQPLIEPLFGGRSTIEVLALLETGKEQSGYDLVRETWKPILGADFEGRWERVLHDGVLADLGAEQGTQVVMLAQAGEEVEPQVADFVWFTAALPKKDYCADLRQ